MFYNFKQFKNAFKKFNSSKFCCQKHRCKILIIFYIQVSWLYPMSKCIEKHILLFTKIDYGFTFRILNKKFNLLFCCLLLAHAKEYCHWSLKIGLFSYIKIKILQSYRTYLLDLDHRL